MCNLKDKNDQSKKIYPHSVDDHLSIQFLRGLFMPIEIVFFTGGFGN